MNASRQNNRNNRKLIGLLPAGGTATRIAPLPCSKELYPIGFRTVDKGRNFRPKVVCHYLLEKMRLADVTEAYIILRKGKWDIPAYLGDGSMLDMHLAYLILNLPFGVPYTLDQAYPFVQNEMVVFGFPDIVFQPDDAFVRLLDQQAESDADIVLGLFPAHQHHKMDMVDLDADGRIRGIEIKPAQTHLSHTWIIAVWTPKFTRFIHEFVLENRAKIDEPKVNKIGIGQKELYLGDVIGVYIKQGMCVDRVFFDDGFYLDIGTPEDLVKTVNSTTWV